MPAARLQPTKAGRRQTNGWPISTLTAPACLLLACGVCLLDDALFLVIVAAALAVTLLALGARRLMTAAGRRA